MIVTYHASTILHTHITIDCLAGHRTGAIAIDDSSAVVSYDTASSRYIIHILECGFVITVGNCATASIISNDTPEAIISINPPGIVTVVNLRLGSVAYYSAGIVR